MRQFLNLKISFRSLFTVNIIADFNFTAVFAVIISIVNIFITDLS